MRFRRHVTYPGNARRLMVYRCARGLVLRVGSREYSIQRGN